MILFRFADKYSSVRLLIQRQLTVVSNDIAKLDHRVTCRNDARGVTTKLGPKTIRFQKHSEVLVDGGTDKIIIIIIMLLYIAPSNAQGASPK